MYRNLPPLERNMKRWTAAAGWAFIAFSGFGGTFFTGTTVTAVTGQAWIATLSSALTLVAALVAIVGVVVGGRFWSLEWVASTFVGVGLAYYVIIPWTYLLDGEMGRMQQAGVVAAALIGFVGHRYAVCWCHHRKLVRLSQLEKLVDGE